MEKISKGTVIRTVVFVLAIINGALSLMGKSPLPIDEVMIEEIITYGFLVVSGLVTWWKDNDFSARARTNKATIKSIEEGKLIVTESNEV